MFDTETGPRTAFQEIEDQIVGLTSHITAATARLLRFVAEADSCGMDFGEGQTVAHWLAWRCSMPLRAAKDYVRVACALRDLPKTSVAFESGEISFHKVASITRIATPETEDTLLEWAVSGTCAQLERIVNSYLQVVASEDLGTVNMRHAERYLDHRYNSQGAFVIKGMLDPEDGAIVAQALEALIAAGSNSEDSFDQRRADALVAMAETALDSDELSGNRGDRYQVVVHVDAAALTEADPDARAELFPDVSIHSETARRLSCDCSIVPLIEKAGEPLDVGRKTRRIPTGTRRAMAALDRGCRWPGCGNRRWIDGHHILHWIRGGETKLVNLISLCRRHHRKVHEGGFEVRLTADGEFEFVGPGGWVVEASPPLGPAPDYPSLNTASLAATYVDDCDYGVAVEALLPKTFAADP